jgi:hypothetical protein
MNILYRAQTAILIIISCLVLTPSVSASVEITAYIGDTIPLSGYSYGSPTAYLLLTGPNLPVNGVAFNDYSTLPHIRLQCSSIMYIMGALL